MSGRIIRERSSSFLKTEGKRVWNEFVKIRKMITGIDDPRVVKYLRELRDGESGGNFYTYFPFLFAETFPGVSRDKMHKVALTGLLTLYHLLVNDEIADQKDAQCPAAMLASNSFHLHALSTLSQAFIERPLPFKDILKLYRQYGLATLIEDGEHRNKIAPYEDRDKIRVLSRKSAMAKIIVVFLCRLADRADLLKPLEDSFDYYYAVEQLFDDFKDWKEDLDAGRYTYLLTSVIISFNLQEKLVSLAPKDQLNTVGKYLYLSGFAEDYLLQAIRFCVQAKKSVEGVDCPQWKERIDSMMIGLHGVRSEVATNSRRARLQTTAYRYSLAASNGDNGRLEEPPIECAHPVWKGPRSAEDAARAAAEFLIKANGFYEDFMAFGETLPIWVSAYVGTALEEWARLRGGARPARKSRRLHELLKQMSTWLASERQQIGWPCLRDVPEDADTTAWVLGFMAATGTIRPGEKQEFVRLLLGFQQSDGGFGTIPAQGRSGFESYGMSHVEVTAAAVDSLLKLGVHPGHESVLKAVEFIRRTKEADGIWPAFWWDGQMYATFFCIRALLAVGETFSPHDGQKMAERIIEKQAPEGCWGVETTGKNLSFETALAVRGLMRLGATAADQTNAVERGLTWLLNFQNGDGGFPSAPMLRIPSADDLSPWTTKQWERGSAAGLGVLVADHNGYFTTATALGALTDFLRANGDRDLVVTKLQT